MSNKLKAALIATGFMPKGMDPFEAVDKLAAMGYKGYEMPMMAMGRDMATGKSKYTEEEALKKLRSVGLEPLTAGFGVSPEREVDDAYIASVIDQAHRYGVNRVTAMVVPLLSTASVVWLNLFPTTTLCATLKRWKKLLLQ